LVYKISQESITSSNNRINSERYLTLQYKERVNNLTTSDFIVLRKNIYIKEILKIKTVELNNITFYHTELDRNQSNLSLDEMNNLIQSKIKEGNIKISKISKTELQNAIIKKDELKITNSKGPLYFNSIDRMGLKKLNLRSYGLENKKLTLKLETSDSSTVIMDIKIIEGNLELLTKLPLPLLVEYSYGSAQIEINCKDEIEKYVIELSIEQKNNIHYKYHLVGLKDKTEWSNKNTWYNWSIYLIN
jgi:hypothetical protein